MRNNLRPLIEKLETPKAEVARAAGISRGHLHRVLTGRSDPTSTVVGGLLSFLNNPENLRKLGRRKPLSFEEVFGAEAAA
jgi:transcriptional regulator with XRE-family HTH domain